MLSRSEEHMSELQSRVDIVCRLLLEKKKTNAKQTRVGPRSRFADDCDDRSVYHLLLYLFLSSLFVSLEQDRRSPFNRSFFFTILSHQTWHTCFRYTSLLR